MDILNFVWSSFKSPFFMICFACMFASCGNDDYPMEDLASTRSIYPIDVSFVTCNGVTIDTSVYTFSVVPTNATSFALVLNPADGGSSVYCVQSLVCSDADGMKILVTNGSNSYTLVEQNSLRISPSSSQVVNFVTNKVSQSQSTNLIVDEDDSF